MTSASWASAASTQPPVTEPSSWPSSLMNIRAPSSNGADPSASTSVAATKRRSDLAHSSVAACWRRSIEAALVIRTLILGPVERLFPSRSGRILRMDTGGSEHALVGRARAAHADDCTAAIGLHTVFDPGGHLNRLPRLELEQQSMSQILDCATPGQDVDRVLRLEVGMWHVLLAGLHAHVVHVRAARTDAEPDDETCIGRDHRQHHTGTIAMERADSAALRVAGRTASNLRAAILVKRSVRWRRPTDQLHAARVRFQ